MSSLHNHRNSPTRKIWRNPRRTHHTSAITAIRSHKTRIAPHRPAWKRPNKSPGHRAAATRTGAERFRLGGGVRVPAGRCCSSMCCRSSRGRSSARPRGTARPAPSPAWSSPRPSPPPPSSHCPPATPRLARREGLSLSWLGRCGGTGIVLAQ